MHASRAAQVFYKLELSPHHDTHEEEFLLTMLVSF